MADFDEEGSRRKYAAPYTSNHPIPTVQKYREHRHELEEQQKETEEAQKKEDGDESKVKKAFDAVKDIFKGEDDAAGSGRDPYPTTNRNLQSPDRKEHGDGKGNDQDDRPSPPPKNGASSRTSPTDQKQVNGASSSNAASSSKEKDNKPQQSATESAASHTDPKQKRKDMKHIKRDDGGREVTDPVTHLPVVIHDSTTRDLKGAPENEPAPGSEARTLTGVDGASKSRKQLDQEQDEIHKSHTAMKKLFPPPSYDNAKVELLRTYQFALTVGLGSIVVLSTLALVLYQLLGLTRASGGGPNGRWLDGFKKQSLIRTFLPLSLTVGLSSIIGSGLILGIRGWLGKKVEEIWENEVWEAARQEELRDNDSEERLPESVVWLNSLLASVWPLINPDLFTSLADTLEDVMQASLPKLVRMISVDDLGQGSESIRILGIRWLPTGAASQTVDEEGNLLSAKKSQDKSDRTASGEGSVQANADGDEGQGKGGEKTATSKEDKQKAQEAKQEQEAMREGMEAEQGDFVNVELAFAYRARASGKSLKTKAHNAHLYLKFYFPGNIAIPVWVELRGMIGTMRLRLQLTPDPPFFSLCTLTFLGQPRADLSCVPLSKHNLNIMDVPLISGFVQSAVDAAMAEYVAPKSLTLDLKDMLVGDDFKKDTNARGVVVVFIKSAKDFKEGDGGIGPLKGSSDSYVTVSWGKFGKPLASTRIIIDEQKPRWDEWAYVLVGPEELNAEEKLRLQLWDSDKFTADDDLGRVEVDLKELVHSPKTKNKFCEREDRFTAEDPDEQMPGTIQWMVGYFAKTRITDEQLSKQTEDKEVKTKQDLKKQVAETAERKLREATIKDESRELAQQKTQDYKEREDALVISAPPDEHYPSGVFSIQIHNVTGLEVENLRKRDRGGKTNNDEDEDEAQADKDGDDMPSSYCCVILNHRTVYKTRTKPKNSKPFFNAATERFIMDWQTADVVVTVRDAREAEDDALLGLVHLPLAKLFKKRAQVNEIYPLAGGIGYGRIRLSMVWRSTELKAPVELRGWDYGTLEIKGPVKSCGGELKADLCGLRLKLRSNISKAKMHSQSDSKEGGSGAAAAVWMPKRHAEKKEQDSIFLAVRKRYACPISIEFRKSTLGPDKTAAFAVFWLSEVPDEEEKTIKVKVWKDSKGGLKRAKSCVGYEGMTEKGQGDGDEVLGEIELQVKFWRGLSGWHEKWADGKNGGDAKLVMEALDVVSDVEGGDGVVETQESDSDSSSSDDDDEEGEKKGVINKLKSTLESSHNSTEDGSRGAVAQLRDYKDHHKQLHRQHRGVMQFRGARTMDWMAGKAKNFKGRIEGVFEHGEREPDVETEV